MRVKGGKRLHKSIFSPLFLTHVASARKTSSSPRQGQVRRVLHSPAGAVAGDASATVAPAEGGRRGRDEAPTGDAAARTAERDASGVSQLRGKAAGDTIGG